MKFSSVLAPILWLALLMIPLSPVVGDDEKKSAEKAEPELTVTDHEAEIGGETIEYEVTAGTLPQRRDEKEDEVAAEVFFIAYVRKSDDHTPRPLTFCFNGGPGSSSVWLHLGMLGPRKVHLDSDAEPVRPPYQLEANPYSLLDKTDLVFIDPVSTGFSRAVEQDKAKDFHGFREDINSVGRFIHDYLSHFGRWDSPLFLCGESYGTLRAAGLSGHLRDRFRIDLNGIVLVSTVLDFRTIAFDGGNDLPYILFLPGYAATAWYHKQLDDELQDLPLEQFLADVEAFAEGDYADALLKGNELPQEEYRDVVRTFARYTGIRARYARQAQLRVPMWRFGKELLRDEGKAIGRFDSRYDGFELDLTGESTRYDPSAAAIFGPFTAAMNTYLRDDLEVTKDVPYEILTGKVRPWNYDAFENRYVNVTDTLAESMTENPYLKVFVASGYYDLATPYRASHYTFSHLPIDPALRRNVTLRDYPAGHMMYVHEPSLEQLRDDLLKFYADALGEDD